MPAPWQNVTCRNKARDTVDIIFDSLPDSAFITTVWSYAETYSILQRGFNNRRLDRAAFHLAVAALKNEIIDNPDIRLLGIGDAQVLSGLTLIRRHNLNATDAALLTVLLDLLRLQPGLFIHLITSDQRLIRSAAAEGVHVINPEEANEADLSLILSRP